VGKPGDTAQEKWRIGYRTERSDQSNMSSTYLATDCQLAVPYAPEPHTTAWHKKTGQLGPFVVAVALTQ
jgi:hypothetical protein